MLVNCSHQINISKLYIFFPGVGVFLGWGFLLPFCRQYEWSSAAMHLVLQDGVIWRWKCHNEETCDLYFMLFAVSLTTTGLQAMPPFLSSGGISPRSWSCELRLKSNFKLRMMCTALIFLGCVYHQEVHHNQERVRLRILTLLGVIRFHWVRPKGLPLSFSGPVALYSMFSTKK